MALYVIRPPDPPRGEDWLYTVPGQYVEDVVSVSATLTTAVGPTNTVAIDASGNGHDGTYDSTITQGEPGVVSGDAAAGFPHDFPFTPQPLDIPTAACDVTGDLTVVWWWQGAGFSELFSPAAPLDFVVDFDTGPQFAVVRDPGVSFGYAPFVDPAPGGARMIAWRFNGSDWFFYINGALIASGTFGIAPPYSPLGPIVRFGNSVQATGGFGPLAIGDELSFFGSDIGATAIADLYAAGLAGIDTYAPAVLALTPDTYYHLNDATLPTIGRTPVLEITNGTAEVGAYVGSFAPAPVANAFDYSWLVGLSNNSQTPSGVTTTVGLPTLILPAGYTIGTTTPDLGAFDQWSDVTIWWDDRYSPLGGFQPLPYDYHNLLLVP